MTAPEAPESLGSATTAAPEFRLAPLARILKSPTNPRKRRDAAADAELAAIDGLSIGYPPRDWRPVHVLLWEEHRGPVPEGHAIVFRNGDRTDIRLENLACISRAELMRRNTRHNLPPEINQVISLRAALVRKINNRSKAR